jgi:hypothetical protein
MYHPRNSFRSSRRSDRGRYPTRRYVRRIPDLGDAEPESRTAKARPQPEPPWQRPKQLPPMAGTLGPSADPTPRPDHGVGRIIAVSILIMTVVILWAAWGVASLSNWPG